MSRSIPPLLSPYLSLPSESSLILLTGVLGAGTNWLVLRYLSSLLSLSPPTPTTTSSKNSSRTGEYGDGNVEADGNGNGEVKVVFLSFMRDMGFWRDGARKINLDLDKATQQNRFIFIDGLTSLHLPQTQPPAPGAGIILKDPSLPNISQILTKAIHSLSSSPSNSKVMLIIDNPDFLLASSPSPTITQDLTSSLLNLREKVHATILTLSIDTPLLSSPSSSSSSHTQTPLETKSATFALGQAHQSDLILGVRLLDTGAARDVSGVLRVTRGGNHEEGEGHGVEEKELLYFVGGDGGVKVFERGQ
ncbi:hypothetical protein NHQ30_005988 [Ciborinia camelliae]|nr:hypothetical protein NHQ30_005988 [Ciborinia camelliae]